MAFGWTDAGFIAKRYTDIQASLAARYEAATGTKVTLRRTPVLWMLFGVSAYALKEVWDVLQVLATDSLDPDAASGAHLDNLAAIRGFERLGAARSTVTVDLTSGTPGTTVSAGATLRHVATGDLWRTTTTFTVDVAGEASGLELESVETGIYQSALGEAFEFVTPVVTAAIVAADSSADGRDVETDAELRERMLLSQYAYGRGTVPGLRARLLEVEGVQACTVETNRTSTTSGGLPPHSFRATLYPETVDEVAVARVLWENAPMGIASSGTETAIVIDDMGYQESVQWSYATELDLYLNIVLAVDDAVFPGVSEVRAAVTAWATTYLGVGDDVRPHEILTAVENAVPGITEIEVRLKFGSAPGGADTSNLDVDPTEIAVLPDPEDGDYATRIAVTPA